MVFTLPNLPYAYDALEPHIDARTMAIHHTKHHQAYVHGLNQAIAETPIASETKPEAVLLDTLMHAIGSYSMSVRNNAGGHFNHSFFWESLAPAASRQPNGPLGKALEHTFGSFDAFKQVFTTAAATRFGSGWAWLSLVPTDGCLRITSTANQDNPCMTILPLEAQGIPLLGLDVWEHAYYLLYQNSRLDYITAFWNLIHWERIEHRFAQANKVLAERKGG